MCDRIQKAKAAVEVAQAEATVAEERYRQATVAYNNWAARQPVGFVGKAVGDVPDTATPFGEVNRALAKLALAQKELFLAQMVTITADEDSGELLTDLYVLGQRNYQDTASKARMAAAILTLSGRGHRNYSWR